MMSAVSIEEKGDCLVRVQTESPHLVSLGCGRLSTAVTIHPLSQELTVIGSGIGVDIQLTGPGIETRHCCIENTGNHLYLHPTSVKALTTIDGNKILKTTRLSQGCVLGIGHNTYFRFNHPTEAKLMKKSLNESKDFQNSITFFQASCDGNSPKHHQTSRSRDSWCEITDIIDQSDLKNETKDAVSFNSEKLKKRPLSTPSPTYNRNIEPFKYLFETSNELIESAENTPIKSSTPKEKETVPKNEQLEIDEMLAICSEYERQAQLERSNKPTQNRIITNGSLPREKRLNSPASPMFQRCFTFDSTEIPLDNNTNLDMKKSPHSYDNPNFSTGSPRPRIKTILNKESAKEFIIDHTDNPIPLCLNELEKKEVCSNNNNNNNNNANHLSSQSTCQYENINKTEVVLRNKNAEINEERRTSIAELNAKSKYDFFGFDPRNGDSNVNNFQNDNDKSKLENYILSDIKLDVVKNFESPSWINPKLDIDYPDYDLVDNSEISNSKRMNLNLEKSEIYNNELYDKLKNERLKIMEHLSSLKKEISELEIMEQEQIRETELESALISGEILNLEEKLQDDEIKVNMLKQKIKDCDNEMDECLKQQNDNQIHFQNADEKYHNIINTLENQIKYCHLDEMKLELLESLKQQQELLDVEKKNYEDLEFHLMEEEAVWLSRREDLQKELQELLNRARQRHEKLNTFKKVSVVQKSTGNFEFQRIKHLREIEQKRHRLRRVNIELEKISKTPSTEVESCESTTDDECLQKHQITTSQDDLDRISRVTSKAPLEDPLNTLGRKTLASLQEIERNRQLHLAKQGSLVIQEERQRVEELKRRVQDEVKAQWEQHQRESAGSNIINQWNESNVINSNTNDTKPLKTNGLKLERDFLNLSLTSVMSEDSSMTSSLIEQQRDSGVGSEETEKRTTPEDNKVGDVDSLMDKSDATTQSPISRPQSDEFYMDEPIKMRPKSSSSRPLTRFLPICGEGLDLRQHVIDAGHQVSLCPHIVLDRNSCRGWLIKMALGRLTPTTRWHKRWFVFDRQKRALVYYSDKSEKKSRGGAYFQAIEEVYVDYLNSFKSPNPKATFVVKSSKKNYYLVAPEPGAMRIWIDVIFTGAEGYQF